MGDANTNSLLPQRLQKICCVSLHSYPVINPSAKGGYGGTETRAWTICRGLAQQSNVTVCLVVRNQSLKHSERIENVTIIPKEEFLYWTQHAAVHSLTFRSTFPYVGIRQWSWRLPFQFGVLVAVQGTRRLIGRRPRPHSVYTSQNCDLYFAFGVHSESATVIASAKSIGKKTVLFLGADSDVDERFQPDSKYRTQYGERAPICHYVLTKADLIVSQTEFQRKRLKKVFGRESIVMPNPIDCDFWANPECDVFADEPLKNIPHHEYVLWIGRADDFHKRPGFMIELARQLPGVPFVMLMNPRDLNVEMRIQSEKPDNVHIINELHYSNMPALFQRAKAFVNTSAAEYEGFPNTFLQAAASGTPIISLEVCETFLSESQAGVCTRGDSKLMTKLIEEYWNRASGEAISVESVRNYLKFHHDVQTLSRQLLDTLDSALE